MKKLLKNKIIAKGNLFLFFFLFIATPILFHVSIKSWDYRIDYISSVYFKTIKDTLFPLFYILSAISYSSVFFWSLRSIMPKFPDTYGFSILLNRWLMRAISIYALTMGGYFTLTLPSGDMNLWNLILITGFSTLIYTTLFALVIYYKNQRLNYKQLFVASNQELIKTIGTILFTVMVTVFLYIFVWLLAYFSVLPLSYKTPFLLNLLFIFSFFTIIFMFPAVPLWSALKKLQQSMPASKTSPTSLNCLLTLGLALLLFLTAIFIYLSTFPRARM